MKPLAFLSMLGGITTVLAIFSPIAKVRPGHRAIKVRFGQPVLARVRMADGSRPVRVYEPGWHVVWPFVDAFHAVKANQMTIDCVIGSMTVQGGHVYGGCATFIYDLTDAAVVRAVWVVGDGDNGANFHQLLTRQLGGIVGRVVSAYRPEACFNHEALSDVLLQAARNRLAPDGVVITEVALADFGPTPGTQLAQALRSRADDSAAEVATVVALPTMPAQSSANRTA